MPSSHPHSELRTPNSELPVWQEAARLYELTEDLLDTPAFRATSGFRNQIDRAALSVSNNIAEGFERGTTPDRIHFLYIAKGSAGEVRSQTLVKLRRIQDPQLRERLKAIHDSAESCCRQLAAWADHLQNTNVPGQRHLNDHSREQYRKHQIQEAAAKQWQETRLGILAKLPETHHLKQEARRKGEL